MMIKKEINIVFLRFKHFMHFKVRYFDDLQIKNFNNQW